MRRFAPCWLPCLDFYLLSACHGPFSCTLTSMPEITPAEEEIAYFHQLGLALSVWSNIEGQLLEAVLRCVPSSSEAELTRNSLAMGFVSMQGARNKILFAGAMVRRVLESANPAAVGEWNDIQEKLFAESGKRNDLAHYQSRPFPRNDVEGRRWALCPWHHPKGINKDKPPPDSYCLLDLVTMEYSFMATSARLANFLARICSQREPFPKSYEQPADLPDLRQIARQIHAELGHPQKSSRERRIEESARNAAASWETPDVTRQTPDAKGG